MPLNGLCAMEILSQQQTSTYQDKMALKGVWDPGLRVKHPRVVTLSKALPEVEIKCDHAQEFVTWSLAGLQSRLSMAWYWWSVFGREYMCWAG